MLALETHPAAEIKVQADSGRGNGDEALLEITTGNGRAGWPSLRWRHLVQLAGGRSRPNYQPGQSRIDAMAAPSAASQTGIEMGCA